MCLVSTNCPYVLVCDASKFTCVCSYVFIGHAVALLFYHCVSVSVLGRGGGEGIGREKEEREREREKCQSLESLS